MKGYEVKIVGYQFNILHDWFSRSQASTVDKQKGMRVNEQTFLFVTYYD